MKNMKKRRKKIYALILLLVITIGYALISTTLKINGVAGIKSNQWDIHWENVQPNQQSTVTTQTPQITENRTKVSYEVNLELPGDFYEFTVDAKNDGTINAKILDVRHSVYLSTDLEHTTTLPSYIKYSIVYDGTEDAPAIGDILDAGDKQTYRIRIEYDPLATTLPGSDTTYKIIDEIDYGQTKDEPEQTGFSAPKPDNGPTLGGLRLGDEVCIGNDTIGKECFNVLKSDDNTTKMLAKYNLKVGYNCPTNTRIRSTNDTQCSEISNSIEGYGKQSQNESGTIEFYNNDYGYWFQKVGEGADYIYQGKIYDYGDDGGIESYEVWDNLPFVYDQNSVIYPYVQNYVEYLKTIGANSSTTGTLLSVNLINETLNCLWGVVCEEPEKQFIHNTWFWTGSAVSGSNTSEWYSEIMDVMAGDDYGGSLGCSYRSLNGIRPVIEVPTSSIVFDGWRFVNPGSTGTNQKYEYWAKGKRIEEGLIPNLPDYSNNPQTYYFKNGYVQYGWQKINDKVYYFRDTDTDQEGSAGYGYTDGNMVYGGTINIGGTDYTFDNDGVCTSNNCPTL